MGYASGHYDRETAVGIAVGRAAAMTQAEGNGGIVALGIGVQKAKLMIKKDFACARVDSGLWIAGINSIVLFLQHGRRRWSAKCWGYQNPKKDTITRSASLLGLHPCIFPLLSVHALLYPTPVLITKPTINFCPAWTT